MMLAAVILLALSASGSPPVPSAAFPVAPSTVPLEFRQRMVEQINRDRAVAGLPAVEFSAELSRAADEHCQDMIVEGYTSHWNRAGWKPYVRYARAGIRDFTAENIWSLRGRNQLPSLEVVWPEMLNGHRQFLAEQPPRDGHRRTILTAAHTHVGVGVAWTRDELRMIQLFATRGAEMEALPVRVTPRERLMIRGRLAPGRRLHSISVFYEPLPRPMTHDELQSSDDYGLPEEERIERPRLAEGIYSDGSRGAIFVERDGRFRAALVFWKGQPGIYTVAVWARRGRQNPVLVAMTSVEVSAAETSGVFPLPRRAFGAAGPAPAGPSLLRPGGASALRRGD